MEKSGRSYLYQIKSLISSFPKFQLIFFIIGIILISGVLVYKLIPKPSNSDIEIVSDNGLEEVVIENEIVIDIKGEVVNPGVYHLKEESRVDDALNVSGGLTENADIEWVDKNLNSASKLVDGQKIYIPSKQSNVLSATTTANNTNVAQSENSQGSSMVNINSASLSELDKLPGIGQVYGQSIIDHRPYSTLEELVSKKAIKQSVFEKIKNLITVF